MDDQVHHPHQAGYVAAEAQEVDPVGDAQLGAQAFQVRLIGFLPEQRAADDDGVQVGDARHGADEDVLALPGRQTAEHAGELLAFQAELAAQCRDVLRAVRA